jgi:predicted XRE-type DNA-binding protein
MARLEVLRLMLQLRHPDIAFIDYKEYAQVFEGDGWWFNHNRGSNEYLSKGAIASFGIPYQDIGSLQMIYITLTGDYSVERDSPGFAAFVEWQAQAEIAQCVGRLRANRRPDEPVTYYSCADFELEFLGDYYPGAAITTVAAFSIDDKAGTATEQSHHQVQSAIFELVQETGMALEKITQAAAATVAGVTQGRISQIAAKYGGWKAYKKILAVLYNSIYRPANNSDPLDSEQEFIANTYLPLAADESPPDAVQAVVDCIQVYGWRVFQAILAATSIETRGRLLAVLVSGLPQGLQEEFRGVAGMAAA